MKKLEYIGPKVDGERHLSERTGIVWKPGDVHEVAPEHAEDFLKHPTSWREVAMDLGAAGHMTADGNLTLAKVTVAADAAQLPAWASKGIELGATDEQLEAVGQAGGPETEQGAALWKDATGTDWTPTTEVKATVKEPKAAKVPAKKAAAKKAPAKKAKAKKAAE